MVFPFLTFDPFCYLILGFVYDTLSCHKEHFVPNDFHNPLTTLVNVYVDLLVVKHIAGTL